MQKRYNTKQQEMILSCLRNDSGAHLTAEMILIYLKEKGENIGLATVYRTLDKLVANGTVLKYSVPNGMSACYKYAQESCRAHDHYHLICTECGKMTHLECSHLDSLADHVLNEHGFDLDNLKTVFYGKCRQCSLNSKGNL